MLQGKLDEIFERGIIQAEALNFIRGRSIVKTYLIIDEAQNTTPAQIKGIITRAGKDTKIILLGDPGQIDRPFLDEADQRTQLCFGTYEGKPAVLADHNGGGGMRAFRSCHGSGEETLMQTDYKTDQRKQ